MSVIGTSKCADGHEAAPPQVSSPGFGKLSAVPELFEAVLDHLDMRTLLTSSQRVSRAWNHFIRGSPKLQKALFFRPDDSSSPTGSPIPNPLLAELFPTWFVDDGKYRGLGQYEAQPFGERGSAMERPEASWRTMLIQQQPAARILVEWKRTDVWTGKVIVSSRSHECSNGLRMGHYYDISLPSRCEAAQIFWARDFDELLLIDETQRGDRFDRRGPRKERKEDTTGESISEKKEQLAAKADIFLHVVDYAGSCGTGAIRHRQMVRMIMEKYSVLFTSKDSALEEPTVTDWNATRDVPRLADVSTADSEHGEDDESLDD